MKRFTCLFLVSLFVLLSLASIVSCGQPGGNVTPTLPATGNQTTPPPSPTPSPTPMPAPMPTPTPKTTPSPTVTPEARIPIIDAHSQVCPENLDKVIQLMDQAGVACTILSAGMTSTRGIVTPEELVSFASNYPRRIVPAVRTKIVTGEDYYKLMEKQMNMSQFGAMAEVLMYHAAEKAGRTTILVVAHPTDESVQTALKYALDKEWPFIAHIEFVAAGSQRDQFMTELKALLVQYPEHPFILIHMGQLDRAAVQQLIEAHGNIYFITSASTPSYAQIAPWTNMFDGRNLSADWKQLIIKHPDRFIMGFDMVWPEMWGPPYLGLVAVWREALKELPVEVAHAFAHGNAERLWHLPPVSSVTPAPAAPAPTPMPAPKPQPDTAPPSAITGLVTVDAYDGRVNLSWGKSTAEDFSHYNIYVNKAEILDAKGMTPSQKITAISTNTCQVTGLEAGTKYYFAVTAADKGGNENKRVASVSATPAPMPRGTVDPDFQVDVYQSELAWPGTTLFSDNHILSRPRIIEVNMLGEIVWQYLVPENLRQNIYPQAGMNPGFAVELLPNNNILFVSPRKGVYEINRGGDVVWSYETQKITHDADRLPNGNTIFVFGGNDQKDDAQVTEVNPKGEIVWAWYAKDYFDKPPYNNIAVEGWTHTNAVTRLTNGNTLISPRNFNFVVEVDPKGEVVRTLGEGLLYYQHEPVILPNGNLLSGSHGNLARIAPELAASITSYAAVEIDLKTGKIVWKFMWPPGLPQGARDANRLPNGNTLVQEARIAEVTTEGKIVWQLRLKEAIETEILSTKQGMQTRGFYKADRISAQK